MIEQMQSKSFDWFLLMSTFALNELMAKKVVIM